MTWPPLPAPHFPKARISSFRASLKLFLTGQSIPRPEPITQKRMKNVLRHLEQFYESEGPVFSHIAEQAMTCAARSTYAIVNLLADIKVPE